MEKFKWFRGWFIAASFKDSSYAFLFRFRFLCIVTFPLLALLSSLNMNFNILFTVITAEDDLAQRNETFGAFCS